VIPVSVYRVVPLGQATVADVAFIVPSVDWQNVREVIAVDGIGGEVVAP
jgi:hypothetical protein